MYISKYLYETFVYNNCNMSIVQTCILVLNVKEKWLFIRIFLFYLRFCNSYAFCHQSMSSLLLYVRSIFMTAICNIFICFLTEQFSIMIKSGHIFRKYPVQIMTASFYQILLSQDKLLDFNSRVRIFNMKASGMNLICSIAFTTSTFPLNFLLNFN